MIWVLLCISGIAIFGFVIVPLVRGSQAYKPGKLKQMTPDQRRRALRLFTQQAEQGQRDAQEALLHYYRSEVAAWEGVELDYIKLPENHPQRLAYVFASHLPAEIDNLDVPGHHVGDSRLVGGFPPSAL